MSEFSGVEGKMDSLSNELNQIDANLVSLEKEAAAPLEWPATRVRQYFIDNFCDNHDHTFWRSCPVVPINDPTLLFINAGMNQYKPLFLGTCDPTLEMSKLKRAVNSQKCIRAGGKHNDLDDVGKDVYHHTYFEMLGNWSFGDYFKEDCITWSWKLLVEGYKLDPDRLYATYFGGEGDLPSDDEARDIWLRFLPKERVISSNFKDNFWEMGATGPCGPCSEIHYDRIGNRDAAYLVNADVPDVIEIWNNVFIQYNREEDGSLKDLPAKHVDTGMGLERLVSILQDKDSNYDTDIFTPIFAVIKDICKCDDYGGLVGEADAKNGFKDMAYRVLADHIRTLSFAIADGAVPASDGRGYVLRRILRRAVRYGTEILNAPAGFFTKLVPIVVQNFSGFFPELKEKQALIEMILAEEEASFVKTLDSGCKHFKKVVAQLQKDKKTIVSAKDAHFLFSSLGFPVDLTELMAEEVGMSVDTQGFEEAMERDRGLSADAEKARKGGGSKDLTMQAEQTSWLQDNGIAITDADDKYIWNTNVDANVSAIFTGRGQQGAGFVDNCDASEGIVGLILSKSSYYYEIGGQIYDTGKVILANGSVFNVTNCQAYAGYVVHVGELLSGSVSVGGQCSVSVDYERRALIAPNHTMTHVLNFALRKVLVDDAPAGGIATDVDQKGSLVDSDKLRFDFSWNGPLTPAQLKATEDLVNAKINSEMPVYAEEVPLALAQEVSGLRCIFGDQYPDPVRVISVGYKVSDLLGDPSNPKWKGDSIEFCGGTHLTNTKEAEQFCIVEESGIAKGIRRIVGFTRIGASKARATAANIESRLIHAGTMDASRELLDMQKLFVSELEGAVISVVDKIRLQGLLAVVQDKIKAWNKANAAARSAEALNTAETAAQKAIAAGDKVCYIQIDSMDGASAKKVTDKLKKMSLSTSFFVSTIDTDANKVGLYPLVCKEHQAAGLSAKEWNDACFTAVGAGKGGGKAESAVGNIPGGADVLKIVMDASSNYVANKSI